jgi:hypothetical protein
MEKLMQRIREEEDRRTVMWDAVRTMEQQVNTIWADGYIAELKNEVDFRAFYVQRIT